MVWLGCLPTAVTLTWRNQLSQFGQRDLASKKGAEGTKISFPQHAITRLGAITSFYSRFPSNLLTLIYHLPRRILGFRVTPRVHFLRTLLESTLNTVFLARNVVFKVFDTEMPIST